MVMANCALVQRAAESIFAEGDGPPVEHPSQETRELRARFGDLKAAGAPLGARELAVYLALYEHRPSPDPSRPADRECAVWPAVATVAAATLYSIRAVREALRRLEAWGLLRAEVRPGRATVYRFDRITHRRSRPAPPRAPRARQLRLRLDWGTLVCGEAELLLSELPPGALEAPPGNDTPAPPAAPPPRGAETPAPSAPPPRHPLPSKSQSEGPSAESARAVLAGSAHAQAYGPAPARDARTPQPDPGTEQQGGTEHTPAEGAGVWLGLRLEGLTVAGVEPGSPAQRAGLEAGDRLASAGGVPLERLTPAVLVALVAAMRPGDVLRVGWWRGRERCEGSIRAARRPRGRAPAG